MSGVDLESYFYHLPTVDKSDYLSRKLTPFESIGLGMEIQSFRGYIQSYITENLLPPSEVEGNVQSSPGLQNLILGLRQRVNQLALGNEHLVKSRLSKYAGLSEEEQHDLYLVGFMALQRAALKYDPWKKAGLHNRQESNVINFSTYANGYITKAVKMEFSHTHPDHNPLYKPTRELYELAHSATTQIQKAEPDSQIVFIYMYLTDQLGLTHIQLDGINLFKAQLATYPKVKADYLEAITEYQKNLRTTTSWTTPENPLQKDFLLGHDPELRYRITSARERINVLAAEHLTPKELLVIQKRLGVGEDAEELTLEKIGEILHVKRERIRQIEINAFRKLKRLSRFHTLLSQIVALQNQS